MTARTIQYSDIQGHLLPMSTYATCLTRIGRIDFDKRSASFFRFARELSKECRPRGICNAFGQTVIMNHSVDLQVFHTDDPETIYDLAAFLVGEVVSSEGDPLMHSCYDLAVLPSLRRALRKFGVFPLPVSQGFLFFTKEPGVFNLFTGRECSKRFESHVNTYLGRGFWQTFDERTWGFQSLHR